MSREGAHAHTCASGRHASAPARERFGTGDMSHDSPCTQREVATVIRRAAERRCPEALERPCGFLLEIFAKGRGCQLQNIATRSKLFGFLGQNMNLTPLERPRRGGSCGGLG